MSIPTQHHLKTWPQYFRDLRRGVKTFELRKYDRAFAVGHELILEEYDPETGLYTDEFEVRKVVSLYTDLPFGLEPGYCLMGIRDTWEWQAL